MSYSEDLHNAALAYHRLPRPGKLEIQATKPLANQRDLALAYSPGVAAACTEIAGNPAEAATLTARANLVAVVSNGTAVLGLGNIGPLASKPVMEGKAVLFKKFAGIDVFDIEIAADTIDRVVETVAALEPTFGGINLEDIKGPECFEIETRLKERMKIPVFHDDQHGTAIIVGAAITNGLLLNGKKLSDVKIVCSGAGAAAIACLNLLVSLGAKRENIWVCDIEGLVYEGREKLMDRWKGVYAQKSDKRKLADVIGGADIFLGLSAPRVLTADMVKSMAEKPLVMALANPDPEIMPDEARAARPDAMICTGRSDFPNQVNNVLCFPFIFRGALDVGATAINEEMKHAAVDAIAQLARDPPSDVVMRGVDSAETQGFGPGSLIPSPFDPRLIQRIAPAVAKAAMDSGVATRPIKNFDEYTAGLERFAFRSGLVMKPVFAKAKSQPVRVIYAEGEDERVLRATQQVLEEKLAKPILVGRPSVVETRIKRIGLGMRPGRDFDLVNPEDDPRYRSYVQSYIEVAGRRGVTPDAARTVVRTNNTVIAALAVMRGEADAMICGVEGRYMSHLRHVRGQRLRGAGADDHHQGRLFHRRHRGEVEPERRRTLRDLGARGQARAALQHEAEDRLPVAFGFRQLRHRFVTQDAAGEGAVEITPSGARSRWRDAGRHGPLGSHAKTDPAGLYARRGGQHPDHAESGCRQYRLSDGQGADRCRAGRADPDRTVSSRAHPHPVGDRARRSEHDGGRGRRGPGAGGAAAAEPVHVRSGKNQFGNQFRSVRHGYGGGSPLSYGRCDLSV
jgi:malate dehydrogenase (oxaloacetate-decarboxylating)(NADP+)